MSTPAEVRIVVSDTPPSVNHYTQHTRGGRHYETAEAKNFKEAIFWAWHDAKRPILRAKEYAVDLSIYMGYGQRGDVDNFSKCALDGIVACGLIHSDAAITDLRLRKYRDVKNPRTEIVVRTI